VNRQTFVPWFRAMASKLGVGEVRLRFMSRSELPRKELGRYDAGQNIISIDENILANDQVAANTALHELAHAMLTKRKTRLFSRDPIGNLLQHPNNPEEANVISSLSARGGHTLDWKTLARQLNVDTEAYVDREPEPPMKQLQTAVFDNERLASWRLKRH